MTKTEFIEMIQQYAKNEVIAEATKYAEEISKPEQDRNLLKANAYLGASNEAQKFYDICMRSYIQ